MAIARRTSGKYIEFPDKPVKEDIVEFLEKKGFKRVDLGFLENKFYSLTLKPGEKLYSLGSYTNKAHTKWIKFLVEDQWGYEVMFTCRTATVVGPQYDIFTSENERPTEIYDYDSFKREVEKYI